MDSYNVCGQIPVIKEISWVVITSAALVDSINPCAIAVLLILLGSLLTLKTKRQAVLTGLSFVVGLFVAYFLAGFGLFHALTLVGIAKWFHLVVGILAIIIGLSNVKDYFWYGAGGFVTEIPNRWRPKMKNI
ncbi:TPA: hypothetical protein DD449_04985 [Candidatus Berkelbacteria bacterium]|uniref:Cytochrome c biogenesis protein, transmembrane region n=1 Tax=Berkelbacteria bacterium GW2011_GWE1_39_12 TaxID=1618337 RepID=A0A0G4B5X3_9BACT|nr:MAG: cytochrome c biogenesis protein, transmembrane region [Berkelbacteria bacterium GW2011_GWE1_39_12]HBO61008.1 hypothetical protein [Candidatus Berkelbacteria bacterium]